MTTKTECSYCGRTHTWESDVICDWKLMLTRDTKTDLEFYLSKVSPDKLRYLDHEEVRLVKEAALPPVKKFYSRGEIGSREVYEKLLFNFFDYCHMPSKKDRTISTLSRLNDYERRHGLPMTDPTKRKGKWRG